MRIVAEGCTQPEQVTSCCYGKGVGEGRISDAKVSEPGAQRGRTYRRHQEMKSLQFYPEPPRSAQINQTTHCLGLWMPQGLFKACYLLRVLLVCSAD